MTYKCMLQCIYIHKENSQAYQDDKFVTYCIFGSNFKINPPLIKAFNKAYLNINEEIEYSGTSL